MYGILNLCKPSGPTSRDCVNQINLLLPSIKVAHAGTLDPLASGVLVLLIGPAVRLMEEVHTFDKEYLGRFRLGASSLSGDLETEVQSVPLSSSLTHDDISAAVSRFQGPIRQTPPAFSAIRVDGKRAHTQARRGLNVEMPERSVTIHSIELLECAMPDLLIRVCCSTGTYLRTLGMDIARCLGTQAVMAELVRTRVGPFAIDASIPLQGQSTESLKEALLPACLGASNMPHWTVPDSILRRILDGQRLSLEPWIHTPPSDTQRAAILDERGVLRAIVEREDDGQWHCQKGIAHWDVLPA
jgi:tRNA pseudouridine55 synthase